MMKIVIATAKAIGCMLFGAACGVAVETLLLWGQWLPRPCT